MTVWKTKSYAIKKRCFIQTISIIYYLSLWRDKVGKKQFVPYLKKFVYAQKFFLQDAINIQHNKTAHVGNDLFILTNRFTLFHAHEKI